MSDPIRVDNNWPRHSPESESLLRIEQILKKILEVLNEIDSKLHFPEAEKAIIDKINKL